MYDVRRQLRDLDSLSSEYTLISCRNIRTDASLIRMSLRTLGVIWKNLENGVRAFGGCVACVNARDTFVMFGIV
jgi:hypothetical protein